MFRSFLDFEKMIAPQIIQFMYYIVGGLILLGGVGTGLFTMTQSFLGGIAQILIITPISLVFWRIWCELMILAFKIYDRLGELKVVSSSD